MFLEKADFNSHLYAEIINAITRDTDSIFDQAMLAAISEAEGYLSKYNLDTLFGATGAARDHMLFLVCKDLTCWHFIALASPNVNVAMFRTRYEDGINWLMKVQCGKVVPKNWTLAYNSEGEVKSHWNVTSNTRRTTGY